MTAADAPRIRRFEAGDASRVRSLGGRLTEGFAPWRSPDRVATTVAGWIDDAIEHAAADDHVLLVADDPVAGVVGFVSAAVQAHYIDGRDAYIGELAVDADHGRRGVARALIAAVERWAREQGCDRLTLQTGAANGPARRLYEGLGFAYEDVSFAREIGRG